MKRIAGAGASLVEYTVEIVDQERVEEIIVSLSWCLCGGLGRCRFAHLDRLDPVRRWPVEECMQTAAVDHQANKVREPGARSNLVRLQLPRAPREFVSMAITVPDWSDYAFALERINYAYSCTAKLYQSATCQSAAICTEATTRGGRISLTTRRNGLTSRCTA